MAVEVTGDTFTVVALGAVGAHLLVKYDGALAGVGDTPVGVTQNASFAAGDGQTIRDLKSAGIHKCTVASSCLIGAQLYVAAGGKLDDVANGAPIGVAIEAASANNSVIGVWISGSGGGGAGGDLFIDDEPAVFGTGLDVNLLWSTADASDHSFVLALGDTSQMLHVTDLGAKASDWAITSPTHPTVYIHSNTTPITDYLLIGSHDGTTALIDVVGGTTLELKTAGTARLTVANSSLTIADALVVAVGSTTGTKIGSATTQKLGFWNATPIVQPAGAAQAAPAAYVTGAFGLNSDANMLAFYNLVVAMRTALVDAGIIKGAA